MKIVHLNTYDGNGGAGRAVSRLNQGLRSIGADSGIVCYFQFNPNPAVQAIAGNFVERTRAVANILGERYLIRPYLKDNSIPFSLQRFGVSIEDEQILREADVIHLHWINHGFLRPLDIERLGSLKKKMFWTLHDSNPITGGCHVRYGCNHYEEECGNCPVLKNPRQNDLSHRTWKKKMQSFEKMDFTFVAPSSWMQEKAKQASLARNKPVEFISNALETDIFKPLDRAACREELGISPDQQVILAGYMPSKFDRHKGFPELRETISHLMQNPSIDSSRLLLLFYGSSGEGMELYPGLTHRFLGKISSDEYLVKLYNAADVFLFPSLEESMGYTALESISCGTPVAAFHTSGVTDVVRHLENGYLATAFDTRDLAAGVNFILSTPDRSVLSAQARNWAVRNFSLETIARQHLALYQKA